MTHAEFSTILGLSREDLKDSTIYVYREQKCGKLAIAKPCESCYNMLLEVGVKRIYYTDYECYKEEIL